jgi:S-phase kinase-associated protein 1
VLAKENNPNKTVIEISHKLAKMSKLLEAAIEEDPEVKEIELGYISYQALEVIFNYMKLHNGEAGKIPQPPLVDSLTLLMDPEDVGFVESLMVNRKLFYEVMNASDYLNMAPLTSILCAGFASLIKDKTFKELPEILLPQT